MTKRNKSDVAEDEFAALLMLLNSDREQAWNTYLKVRQRLARFFSDKGCISADECADDTLNRAARKIYSGVEVTTSDPYGYILGIAYNVLREYWKSEERKFEDLDSHPHLSTNNAQEIIDSKEKQEVQERRLQCLEKCLAKLSSDDRELIINYHTDETENKRREHRQSLATRLGIGINVLRIRTCRLRTKLKSCIDACVSKQVNI